jgi:hypothetical protein
MIHIEDLKPEQFISLVKKISSMQIQEKLDGAQLWFGVDQEGQFFTSREGKRNGAKKMYSPDDWAPVSDFNQFRAAHAALEKVKDIVLETLSPGDTGEAEVLYGEQPNSVSYSVEPVSYVALLRPVEGSAENFDRLKTKLTGRQVSVSIQAIESSDGEEVQVVDKDLDVKFIEPAELDASKIKVNDTLLSKFQKFLNSQNEQGMTNGETLTISLNKIPKESRNAFKEFREALIGQILEEYKLPIKDELLKALNAKKPNSISKGPIEGYVLRDENGEQIKVVDKGVFLEMNKFNQYYRNMVQGGLTTTDENADLIDRGGIIGEMRIKLAELFGNRELAKPANAKKALEQFKGDTPARTIQQFADASRTANDIIATKKHALAIVERARLDIENLLAEFKSKSSTLKKKLSDGTEVSLSKDVIARTLTIFAEAKKSVQRLRDQISKTATTAQLAAVIFGGYALALESLTEAKKKTHKKNTLRNDIAIADFAGKDGVQMISTYLTIVFISMIIIQEHDIIGMRKLRNHNLSNLKKWDVGMSELNHWGYAIWHFNDPKIGLSMDAKRIIKRATSQVNDILWRRMHLELSWDKQVSINWKNHQFMLDRFWRLSGIGNQKLNMLISLVPHWAELSFEDKVTAMNLVFMLGLQYAGNSQLFRRFKVIQQNVLLNASTAGENQMALKEGLLRDVVKLAEEDDAPFAGVDPSTSNAAPMNTSSMTTSANIATFPQRLGNSKIIKRKRNPNIHRMLLKYPDPRKDKK